jgi:hypothetical protein
MTTPNRNRRKPLQPFARLKIDGARVLLDTVGHLWIDKEYVKPLAGRRFLPRRHLFNVAGSDIQVVSLDYLLKSPWAAAAARTMTKAIPQLYRKAFPDSRPAPVQPEMRLKDLASSCGIDPRMLRATFNQLFHDERLYAASDMGVFARVTSDEWLSPYGQTYVQAMVGLSVNPNPTEDQPHVA